MQQIAQIPISALVFGTVNVRKQVGDISELRESIRRDGILQPILVRPLHDGRYEVIAGKRRVTAAQELGMEFVPAVIQNLENGDALVASLIENIQRGNLDVEEEGEAYERLIQIYGSRQAVARRVNKSTRHIQEVLDALETLRMLRRVSKATGEAMPSVTTVTARSTQERGNNPVLPAYHAAELYAAWAAVRDEIPAEEQDRKFADLARIIASHQQEKALRILREFKLRPTAPLDEIISRALAPTEVSTRLSLPEARRLEQVAEERGVQPGRVVEEAVRVYVTAQEKLKEVPVQKPPDAVIAEALDLYARQQRREAQLARQREEIQQVLLSSTQSVPAADCRAIIGDAREVLPQMPPASVDLVITSPPYFGLKEYGHNLGVETEHLDQYVNDLRAIFAECFRVLRDGRFACVVVGQFTSEAVSVYLPGLVAEILEDIGYRFRREHIWVKPLGIQGIWNRGTTSFLYNPWPRNTMINIHHEHILIYQKGEHPEVFERRDPLSEEEVKEFCWSVWELPPSEIKGHPAPFPLEIPRRLIKMYSYTGEVILDPFLGSGTTLRAAVDLGRAGIGIEVAETYLALIQRMVPGIRIVRYDKGESLGS